MMNTKSALLAILLVSTWCASYAASKQEIGINIYSELSDQILKETTEFASRIERLNELNKNDVDQIVFPDVLKREMDAALNSLLSSYKLAIHKARVTSLEVAEVKQVKECNRVAQQFIDEEYVPFKAEVANFSNISVLGAGKTEAVYSLATDLAIRSSVTSARFVMETLSNCLVVLDTTKY